MEKLEKQDKFQPRDKSYPLKHNQPEAELLKEGSNASITHPKAASFSLH